MMRKLFTQIFLFGIILGCGANKEFKDITYTSQFQTSSSVEPFEERTYIMSIPKGFDVEKEDFNPEFQEIVYQYSDSAKLYITDNTFAGSPLNGDNKLINGITSIKRESLNDTTKMGGVQKNGRYWEEWILKDIVVGYLDVKESRRKEFKKALTSLVEVNN